MATGDQADFLARIKAALPTGWFPDATPVLDGVLSGPAWAWSWLYALLDYVKKQRRIATATDVNLDMLAADFLGGRLPRTRGEPDASYRARVKAAILREKGTRAAVEAVLETLTGTAPQIFEPLRPADTGAYGASGAARNAYLGYNRMGGYGCLRLPFQAFITAQRPAGGGIVGASGYSMALGGYADAAGKGAGRLMYGSLAMRDNIVTDAMIYGAVAAVMPAATTAWMRIGTLKVAPTVPVVAAGNDVLRDTRGYGLVDSSGNYIKQAKDTPAPSSGTHTLGDYILDVDTLS